MADAATKKAVKNGTKPLVMRYEVYNLTCNNSYDPSKAEKKLGYTSRSCRETIRDEITWLREFGKE